MQRSNAGPMGSTGSGSTGSTRSTGFGEAEGAPPIDWSKVSLAPGLTSTTAVVDPGACSAVSALDARILRDRELDELRRLFEACADWHKKTNVALRSGPDKALAEAFVRAQRQR